MNCRTLVWLLALFAGPTQAANTNLTPAEALKGATVIAARAIGLESECGSLEVGKAADFCVIDAPDVNTWLYHFRPNACVRTVIGGVTAWAAAASGGPDTG